MDLKINSIIKNQSFITYASDDVAEHAFDIDCGEGINIVMIPPAAEAAFKSLTFDMLRGYPHSPNAKEAIKHFWADTTSIDTTRILLGDGTISCLYLINRLFLEKGDVVLGYKPQFSDYTSDVLLYGATYEGIPLLPEENFAFHAERILDAIRPEHKLIYLDNPNNPTGQVLSLSDIELILQKAEHLGICVVVDEAYGDYMAKANSAMTLCNQYDNLIVLKTFSKGFGLAGLRAGYMMLPKSLVVPMGKLTNPYTMNALSRHVAALTIADEGFLLELQEKTAELKKLLMTDWKNLSISKTEASVSICLITHKNPEVDLAAEFAKRRILVISGACFDGIAKNSVRFRIPKPEEMPRILEVMAEIDG